VRASLCSPTRRPAFANGRVTKPPEALRPAAIGTLGRPNAYDAVDFPVRVVPGRDLLDQVLLYESIEHPVHLPEVELPEVPEDAVALAFERVTVDAFRMPGNHTEERVVDAAYVPHGVTPPVCLGSSRSWVRRDTPTVRAELSRIRSARVFRTGIECVPGGR